VETETLFAFLLGVSKIDTFGVPGYPSVELPLFHISFHSIGKKSQ
jgi:hypothetical protein